MSDRPYRRLEGMALEFVSGVLEEKPAEGAIGYTVMFKLLLDFTHFVHMANRYIPGYLESPINAIRPELGGLAYHLSYDYFSGAAGNIHSSQALFNIFSNPEFYMSEWSSGGLSRRYANPDLKVEGNELIIKATQDFRWDEDKRQVVIGDLPVIGFNWALNLLQGHTTAPDIQAPTTKVVLGYAQEDSVIVEGAKMLRGTLYMTASKLRFGAITASDIKVA
jgi:hypothetical protein